MARVNLTDRDYQKINEQMRALAEAKQDIQVAQQGGVACEEHDAACNFLSEAYAKLKAAYFRDRP